MQKRLSALIMFLLGATFFVPIILISSSFIFPFIVPKIVFFRSLVLLMLGAYLLLLWRDKQRYTPRSNALQVAVVGYLVSLLVSTFVGVDWYRSFWDNHERMLGAFTLTHYVLYYFIISVTIESEKQWKTLFRWFLGAGSIVMLLGVWQRFVDPEFLLNRDAIRVSSTLGNPIYYSGYGLFLFLLGAYLFLLEKTQTHWKLYAGVGSFLGLLGILLGGTRGALLGLIAAIGIGLLTYAIGMKGNKTVKKTLWGIIAVGIVLSGLLIGFRQTAFVKGIPAVGRLVNTSIIGGTANTRIMAWGVAIDAWKDRPVFGWGPNNFYYGFNKHYRPEFLRHGIGETWFDNAHNVVMNTLATQGVVGVVFYLGIFVLAIQALIRAYREDRITLHALAFGTTFLIGHFVSIVFVFENPTSWIYFFFILAYITAITKAPREETQSVKRNISSGISTGVFAMIFLLVFATNINPARANMRTFDSLVGLHSNGANALNYYAQANEVPSPHIDDIRLDFVRTYFQTVMSFKGFPASEITKVSDFARAELAKNKALHPKDIRIYKMEAQFYIYASQITGDARYVVEAINNLEEAVSYSPKRQQVRYELAIAYFLANRHDDARVLLEETLALDTQVAESWWRLAAFHLDSGDPVKANELLDEAESQGIVFSDTIQAIQMIRSAATTTN